MFSQIFVETELCPFSTPYQIITPLGEIWWPNPNPSPTLTLNLPILGWTNLAGVRTGHNTVPWALGSDTRVQVCLVPLVGARNTRFTFKCAVPPPYSRWQCSPSELNTNSKITKHTSIEFLLSQGVLISDRKTKERLCVCEREKSETSQCLLWLLFLSAEMGPVRFSGWSCWGLHRGSTSQGSAEFPLP